MMAIACSLLGTVTSCDDSGNNDNTESGVVLTTVNNKTEIIADDVDQVVFQVTVDGMDVTDQGVSVCYESGEVGTCLAPQDGKIVFSTETPGEYVFTAKYNNAESKPVTINAVGKQPIETAGYVKNILIHKFTATDCPMCPQMIAALKQVQESLPDDKLIVLAVHGTMNEGISQFVIPESTELYKLFGVKGFPTGWIDEYMEVAQVPLEIKTAIKRSKQVNPAVVGIDFESTAKGSSIEVKGELAFAEDGNYKICCALMEDDIVYKDALSYGDGEDNSLYNHVLRDYAVETPVTGLELGVVTAGIVKDFTYTITLSPDWKQESCAVLVYVLKESKSGDYNVSNADVAKVGEKAVSILLAE